MRFSETIGHQSVQNQLLRLAQSGRVPHALLFLGPEGNGKLALALALAQYLLCENPGPEDSCGVCPQCSKASKLIHPDLHFTFPAIGANATSDKFMPQWREAVAEHPYFNANMWLRRIGAENQQGNITREECVQIVRTFSLKPFEGAYKILLIWLPEYLGKEGNRLLKLIEEPPDQSVFILIAENQELILNTILSRCQLIPVPAFTDEELVDCLVQQADVPDPIARAAAPLADGDFNEALGLTGSEENDHAQRFVDWLRKCYAGNGAELVPWVEAFSKLGREPQKHFFRYGLHFLRELLVLDQAPGHPARLRPTELETAQKLVKVLPSEKLGFLMDLFSEGIYHIERNANPRILMLDASIRVNRIMRLPLNKLEKPWLVQDVR